MGSESESEEEELVGTTCATAREIRQMETKDDDDDEAPTTATIC